MSSSDNIPDSFDSIKNVWECLYKTPEIVYGFLLFLGISITILHATFFTMGFVTPIIRMWVQFMKYGGKILLILKKIIPVSIASWPLFNSLFPKMKKFSKLYDGIMYSIMYLLFRYSLCSSSIDASAPHSNGGGGGRGHKKKKTQESRRKRK